MQNTRTKKSWRCALFALFCAACSLQTAVAFDAQALDAEVKRAMAATQARGLAIAVIDGGQIVHTGAYGVRNAAGDALGVDTIMYGASLTKTAFAYCVMQLVQAGGLYEGRAQRCHWQYDALPATWPTLCSVTG